MGTLFGFKNSNRSSYTSQMTSIKSQKCHSAGLQIHDARPDCGQ